MKEYMNQVKWKLALPRDVKKRVMADLASSIQSRVEAGQTEEQIMAELGTPAEVAAELNEQMKEFAYVRSPWRWACLALAVIRPSSSVRTDRILSLSLYGLSRRINAFVV